MILSFSEYKSLSHQVTMVDGSFDPIHDGHIEYFRRAKELGYPVLCNIAPDSWTASKHPVLLEQKKRAVVLDSIRFIDFVTASSSSTAAVLEAIKPKIYAKGKDWLDRGGIPVSEQEVCLRHHIEVVYLDTVLNSSTNLLRSVSSTNK